MNRVLFPDFNKFNFGLHNLVGGSSTTDIEEYIFSFQRIPPSYVQDLDFLGFILGLESTVAAEDFVTSTLAFIYPSLLYAPRFPILLNQLLSLSSLR